jgi:predicted metalloprotease
MRWIPGGRSQNLEDRRGASAGGPGGFGRIGIGGVVILFVLSLVFQRDFFSLIGTGGGQPATNSAAPVSDPAEEKEVEFVSFVLDDAQATWARLLPASGLPYRDAKLVLFRDAVHSACGFAQAASGPFYCAGDERVYVDLGFYRELKDRFGAPGDFAQAYVLAHEIGHHVQNLLGVFQQVQRTAQGSPGSANALSVRVELQADCYAGVWAHTTAQRNILEPGDLDEGLGAAASVGDDRIQRMQGQALNPDAFTHGTAAQRTRWFRRGYDSGRVDACDTFAGSE